MLLLLFFDRLYCVYKITTIIIIIIITRGEKNKIKCKKEKKKCCKTRINAMQIKSREQLYIILIIIYNGEERIKKEN